MEMAFTKYIYFSFILLILGCSSEKNYTQEPDISKILYNLFKGDLINDTICCSKRMVESMNELELGLLKDIDFNNPDLPKIQIVNTDDKTYVVKIDSSKQLITLNNKNQLDLDKNEIISLLNINSNYANKIIHKKNGKNILEPVILNLLGLNQSSKDDMFFLGKYYEDFLQVDSSLKYYKIGINLGDLRADHSFTREYIDNYGVDSTINKLWEMYHEEGYSKAINQIAYIYYDAWELDGLFGAPYPSDWTKEKMIEILQMAGEDEMIEKCRKSKEINL